MKQIRLKDKVEFVTNCYKCPLWNLRFQTCNFGVISSVKTDDVDVPKDCPLEDAPCDNYVLRCKAHPDIACPNRTASGDCNAPKLHCVYALEVKVLRNQ